MTTKTDIKEEKQAIYLDDLDERLDSTIKQMGKIALQDLNRQFPDVPCNV